MRKLCIGVFLLLLMGCGGGHQEAEPPQVCSKQQCVDVEIASTQEQRQKGLMFRSSLDSNAGMLFVFDEDAEYAFWMKNTNIPLDIIWIDSEWRVVDLVTALPCEGDPCSSYQPHVPVRYVLEINAGYASQYGFIVGEDIIPRNLGK